MKRVQAFPIFLVLLATTAAAPPAWAGWMWSPHTGWVGPTGVVKDSPEEQLAFAVAFFDRKDFDRARKEFEKLVKSYKESREAAEGQYYLGRCEAETHDYYKAFLAYRKTIQTYPSTKRFDEILEREYEIGNAFLSGAKRKIFGTAAILPARGKAIEVFQAIVDDGPFSEYGELAQYKLGLAHMVLEEYESAVTAFEQLIAKYPHSPLVDDARFQIAQASLKGTFKPDYDQSPTDLAVHELESFLREYPESELSKNADTRLRELNERRAAHEYQVGQFYERRHRLASALISYETVVAQFPGTAWAPQAAARIQVLNTNAP